MSFFQDKSASNTAIISISAALLVLAIVVIAEWLLGSYDPDSVGVVYPNEFYLASAVFSMAPLVTILCVIIATMRLDAKPCNTREMAEATGIALLSVLAYCVVGSAVLALLGWGNAPRLAVSTCLSLLFVLPCSAIAFACSHYSKKWALLSMLLLVIMQFGCAVLAYWGIDPWFSLSYSSQAAAFSALGITGETHYDYDEILTVDEQLFAAEPATSAAVMIAWWALFCIIILLLRYRDEKADDGRIEGNRACLD